MKEDSAISKAFPSVQLLYCFWHNEKTFKKRFKSKTFDCVKEMMLTDSEEKFNEKLTEFNNLGLLSNYAYSKLNLKL